MFPWRIPRTATRDLLGEGTQSGDKRVRLLVVFVIGGDGPIRGEVSGATQVHSVTPMSVIVFARSMASKKVE